MRETKKIFTETSPKIELAVDENSFEADRQPLLFIHAVTMGSYEFEENFMPYFSEKDYAVFAMNWRGHGNSEGRETLKTHSLFDYYEDVDAAVEFIKEKTGKEPILIGHSTGGLLTQIYLSRHSAKVAVLIGVGDAEKSVQGLVGFLSGAFPDETQKYFGSGDSDILMTNAEIQHAIMFEDETAPPNFSEIIDKMTAQKASDVLFQDYTTFQTSDAIGNPKVFIISGDGDPIGNLDAVKTIAERYKGEYHIVHNHRHELMLSQGWRETAEEIEKFLSLS